MGGRGSSLGGRSKTDSGFTIKLNGKTVEFYVTSTGVVLKDGSPAKISLQTLAKIQKKAKGTEGYSTVSKEQHRAIVNERYRRFNDGDDELGVNGTRGRRKLIHRPRRRSVNGY